MTMDKEKTQDLGIEETAKAVLEMTPEELILTVPHLNLEQTLSALSAVQEERDPNWREKTHIILANILNIRWLEAAGRVITPWQTVEMIDYCHRVDKSQQWKLSPLAVGMPHDRFSRVLLYATPEQMDLLKHEGMAEPLQFQLKAIAQESLYQVDKLCALEPVYEQEILSLNLNDLDMQSYQAMLNKFEELEGSLDLLLQNVNKALALTWNTNRIDLIEKLSVVKELCQKALVIVVGHPRSLVEPPKGLYAFFENQLAEVFGHPSDADALKEDDSGIDALSKFNIWHPEDYWDYGLIPHMARKDVLHLDPKEFSDEVCDNHKRRIAQEVQKSLEDLGLVNVKDFKLKGIWSAKMLKDYIDGPRG